MSHFLRGRSDHAPLLIKCGNPGNRGSSFRFLNVWLKHPKFFAVVREAWQVPIHIGGMAGFFCKLMNTKGRLREWSVRVFGNIFSAVREAEELLRLTKVEYDQCRMVDARARLGEVQAVHARALSRKCDFWREKCAIK